MGADILPNTEVGISVAMINPKFAKVTGTFTVALLREGTNVIYDVRNNIPAVTITPGIVRDISFTVAEEGTIQSRKKLMDYHFGFQLTNGLTRSSVILLEFPPTFRIDTGVSRVAYIRFGLEDILETTPVGLLVNANNMIRLTYFHEFDEPHYISLYLRLLNPDNVGETTPVNIRTFLDDLQTIIVDQNTDSAFTIIQDIRNILLLALSHCSSFSYQSYNCHK